MLDGKVIVVKALQFWKALAPSVVNVEGNEIPVKIEHPEKALVLMVVKVDGKVRLDSLEQL